MLPEISRRCLACGAAVRAGSRFCQQCGNALQAEARPGAGLGAEASGAPAPAKGEGPPQEQPAPPAGRPAAPTKDWTPPTKEFAAFEQSADLAGARAATPADTPVAVEASDEGAGPEANAAAEAVSGEEEESPASGEAGEAGRAGDLRGRVARVRDGTRARVGRMREEAIVVLEETPDDSGLRFVLAAAALFVLFIVLLFLSTTVLR